MRISDWSSDVCSSDLVEEVDSEGNRLHHPERIPQAHEVARLVVWEVRQRRRQGLQHEVARLTHGEAPDRVAVEADRPRPLRALDAQPGVAAALHETGRATGRERV